MNCFTGTSMMISEQWKGVLCRRECVEQNWILLGSAVLTAVCIRQFLGTFGQCQKASITFIMSVCLTASISAFPTGRIDVKFDLRAFMKIIRENPKLIKMGKKGPLTRRPNYVSLWLTTLNCHKSYLRMKLYQALRMAEEA